MQISNKLGDNEILVRHIRSTSSIANQSAIADLSRQRQLAKVVDSMPELHLKILSSAGKMKGTTLRINAQGLMENSLRGQKNDGLVFFGCKRHNSRKTAGVERQVVNDFVIPSKDKETERRHRGRHMQIEFNLDPSGVGRYLIRDLGIGFGAFVRLDRPLELRDNQLLNLGESFLIVNLVSDKAGYQFDSGLD
jgi:hypothetical protein